MRDDPVKKFKDKLQRNPEYFIQPTLHIDRQTRAEYVNPEFVKRYGNPFNKSNPESIYLEKSERQVAEKQLEESNRKDWIDKTTNKTQYLMKYMTEYYASPKAVVCMSCNMPNYPDCPHCFHCSLPLFLSKQWVKK